MGDRLASSVFSSLAKKGFYLFFMFSPSFGALGAVFLLQHQLGILKQILINWDYHTILNLT